MDRKAISFKELVEAYDKEEKIPDRTFILIDTLEFFNRL